jgi:hypothetical protein
MLGPAAGTTNITQAPSSDTPADPDGTRGEFNRDAAVSALVAAAHASAQCKAPWGPTGEGKVKLTFDPGTGQVVTAVIVDGPFAGTAVGECVARTFLKAKVSPFDNYPVSVTKSFHVE